MKDASESARSRDSLRRRDDQTLSAIYNAISNDGFLLMRMAEGPGEIHCTEFALNLRDQFSKTSVAY